MARAHDLLPPPGSACWDNAAFDWLQAKAARYGLYVPLGMGPAARWLPRTFLEATLEPAAQIVNVMTHLNT